MLPRVERASPASDPQTTAQSCPARDRASSQIKLLRVEPPRGGSCDAFDVSRMRIGEALAASAFFLGQRLARLFVGHLLDLLQQGRIFGRAGTAELQLLDARGEAG